MQCEMCGTDVPRLRRARVEGTVMNVCSKCVRFGEELPSARATSRTAPGATVGDRLAARQRQPRNVLDSMDEELVDDFGPRIRRGREAKGWTREQLANAIHQPVPTVGKFEAGELHPSDKVVKVLERELGIKLMEAVPQSQMPNRSSQPTRGFTLGDLIKDAKKKQ